MKKDESREYYSKEEIVSIINTKLEHNKNNYLFDGITISDSFGFGYNIMNCKEDDTLIRVYPIHTCYGKVYDTHLESGFGRDYEEWAKENGIGNNVNVDGISTLFNKEVFMKHIVDATERH